MKPWPKVTKTATYRFRATHDLRGVTIHPDAATPHEHDWVVTLAWDWECRPSRGFTRDEPEIDASWGKRMRELEGVHLNDLMPVPPTSESLACWLLFDWLVALSPVEWNYELSRVTVAKCNTFTATVDRKQAERWRAFFAEMSDRNRTDETTDATSK
jgi:6-pyruvoyl-tetrahydropterin synthase